MILRAARSVTWWPGWAPPPSRPSPVTLAGHFPFQGLFSSQRKTRACEGPVTSSHMETAARGASRPPGGPAPSRPLPARPLRGRHWGHSTCSPGPPWRPAGLSLGPRGSPGAREPRGWTQRGLARPCPGTSSCSGSFSGDSGGLRGPPCRLVG